MAQEPQDRLKTRTREELLRSGAASRAIEHFNRIAGNREEVAEIPQKPTQRLVQHRPSCKKHKDHVQRKPYAGPGDSPAVSGGPVEEKKPPAASRRGSSRHRESQRAELPESSPAHKDVQLQRGPVGSESRVLAAGKPALTRSESHSDRSRPPKTPPEKLSVAGKTDKERAGPTYKNPAGPTVEQLWPKSWGAYSDNPDRDSLDGNLPSSSHGTNPPPPPPPILGTVATTAAFNKTPNSKTKHKKLLKGDDPKNEEEPNMSRSDPETGPVVWGKTEPCSQMWVVLSSMYGKLVVLLSIAFCLTEVMDNTILPFTFQGIFMMYLYVGSIIAILCIYITVVADNLPSVTSSKQNLTSAEPDIASLASFGTLKRAHISRSKTTRTSFYLRVGALLFGFGTLVYNGLEIAMHSTTDTACTGEMAFSHPILQSIFTFLQMHFLFVNSEVVVEKFGDVARFGLIHLVATNLSVWFRMVIWDSAHEWIHFVHLYANPNRPLQYGGTPSPQALQLQGFPGLKDLGYNGYVDLEQTTLPSTGGDLDLRDSGILFYGNPFSAYEGLSPPCLNGSVFPFTAHHARRVARLYQCYNNNTLGQMWTKSMPYLFPFIVEYSLVAAAVTYIMWTSVGREKTKTTEVKKIVTTGTLDIRRNKQWRTDCRAASKGLFLGLLCLVGGIVVLIIFFVMKDTAEFQEQMFWLSSGTQLVVLTLSVAMTMVGFYQIPKLSLQHRRQSLPLDSMLSSVTIFGVYMLGIFGVIVGGLEIQEPRHLVLFVLNVTLVVQVTLQGMLVAEASQRHCVSHQQQTIKPGRQVITFLLFSNVTLWMLDTLMSHHWLSHEMQFTYYGFLAWGVISRVGLPLMIFYRFHQAVILVGVWKNTYKTRAD